MSRSAKCGKVFLRPETKAYLLTLSVNSRLGASGVAAVVLEELKDQGKLEEYFVQAQARWNKTKIDKVTPNHLEGS